MKQLQFCTCTVLIAVFLLNLLQRQEESPVQGKAVTDLKGLIGMCQLVKSVYSTSRHKCYGRWFTWMLLTTLRMESTILFLVTLANNLPRQYPFCELRVFFFFQEHKAETLVGLKPGSLYPEMGQMVIQKLCLQMVQNFCEISLVLLLPTMILIPYMYIITQ